MILLDATYINSGGGLGLLQRLLGKLRGRTAVTVLRDIRVKRLDTCGFPVVDVTPSIFARQRFYQQRGHEFARVLCFGNVPPPVRLAVPVKTYFHNILFCEGYVGQRSLDRMLMRLKMAYIRHHQHKTDAFLVQSENMRAALRAQLAPEFPIHVVPFLAQPQQLVSRASNHDWQQFAYVSEAHPHKNHLRLLAAWELLLARGLKPGLHLTVTPAYPAVLQAIEKLRLAGAVITNHGFTDPARLYQQCGYQIYPSLNESYGLGLLEATAQGCAVLAPDLPYVQAAVLPVATFAPLSPAAIAEVVARHSGVKIPIPFVKIPDRLSDLVAWCAAGQPLLLSTR